MAGRDKDMSKRRRVIFLVFSGAGDYRVTVFLSPKLRFLSGKSVDPSGSR